MPALVSLVLQTSGVLHQLLGLMSSGLSYPYRPRYNPVRSATAIETLQPVFIHRTAVASQSVLRPCVSSASRTAYPCITYKGGTHSV